MGSVGAIGSTSIISFEHRVAAGLVPGHDGLNKFGRNPLVAAIGVDEDIIDAGGIYVFPTIARAVTAVSDDAADTLTSGTGAWKLVVLGLDETWAAAFEEVELNGLTPSTPTTTTFIRVFRAYLTEAGTGQTNAGEITVTSQTDALDLAVLRVAQGQTQMACYTVPLGRSLFLDQYYGSLNRGNVSGPTPQANIQVRVRESADVVTSPWRIRHLLGVALDAQSPFSRRFDTPIYLPAKTDIILRCADTNVTNIDISAGFEGILNTL